jgi:hypothetical protein
VSARSARGGARGGPLFVAPHAILARFRSASNRIVELSKNLTPENRETLLPRFFHVSKREAQAITAELQPVLHPPMRTVVTTVAPPAADASRSPDSLFTRSAFHPVCNRRHG